MNTEDQISEYLTTKPSVWINFNNEAGTWQYSVQVCGTAFWLASFNTLIETETYCIQHSLTYEY